MRSWKTKIDRTNEERQKNRLCQSCSDYKRISTQDLNLSFSYLFYLITQSCNLFFLREWTFLTSLYFELYSMFKLRVIAIIVSLVILDILLVSLVHNRHEVISWIGEFRTCESNRFEMIYNLMSTISLVDKMPINHEKNLIKHMPDIRCRLMNGKYNCFSLLTCKQSQQMNYAISCETI